MRHALSLLLLGVLGCGNELIDQRDGGGGDPTSSDSDSSSTGEVGDDCSLPASVMPSPTLIGADGQVVDRVSGVVVGAEGRTLEIDSCVGITDCTETIHRLELSDGLELNVPVGALVEVTVEPSVFGQDADGTPSVRVRNLSALNGIGNPIMTLDALWFLSSAHYTCALPTLEVRTVTTCDGAPTNPRTYELTIEKGPEDLILEDGDTVFGIVNGVSYTFAYFGGWTVPPGEIGACRWQVRRDPTSFD